MKTLLLLWCSLWIATSSFAHTSTEQAFTCPIDGKKFKQTVDASGTQFGMRLDLKPLGPTAAPWSVPQCPKCRFVLYKQSLDADTIKKLKPFILSKEYRTQTDGKPSYFCLALIRAFEGETDLSIGDAYLKASWQVEADPKKCRECLGLAYERLSKALPTLKPADEEFVTVTLLCGELERRLGKFEEAQHRFTEAKADKAFEDSRLQDILKRQFFFIEKKDSAPHAMDAENENLNE